VNILQTNFGANSNLACRLHYPDKTKCGIHLPPREQRERHNMKIVTRLICVGSVMLIGQLAHAANLVQNGSFEDGTYAGSYGEPLPVDWTFTPAADGQSDFFIGALGDGEWDLGIPAEDGSYYAAFGATGVDYDYLSETLSTVSGTNYSLSFWLNNQDSISGASSYFSAYWDGTDIGPDITPDSAEFGWTEFSYTVVGTGSDTLAFGGLNQPAWIALDNVVVTGAVGVPDQGVGLATLTATLLGLCAVAALNRRRLA
jgi:hypothetical protein